MNGYSIILLCFVAGVAFSAELPEKFYGKFDLDHSEKFEEYLEAKGYSWITRKLVTFATFKKEFTKGEKPGTFDYANLTSKKNVFYKNVQLGKEFVGEGLDSTKHNVTFTLVGSKLVEKHVPTESGEAKDESYEYTFATEDGKEFLVVSMEAEGIVAKRFYKRV
ncbi:unnamed protein product [Auanema sp. JU1783]|nr:unnamed protein product [Auanema sp. JU1783]